MARPAALALLCLLMSTASTARGDQPQSNEGYSDEERAHWSLQPCRRPAVPAVADRSWPRQPVDAFILSRLEAAGLRPSPSADRRTLIRRLTFDLTGLPPTPRAVDDFVADNAPDAYGRLVERLLASPRYGEQWGQHWLDVVRYAETEGFEYDRYRPGAWRFRDYVIRSLNADKPYDRFVVEQLAGDELGDEGELLVAAGFHRLGPVRRNAGNAEVAFSRNEVLTERTNIIGSALLGLTLACARCHDHMYDAVRQKDYYRLQAFLAATFEHDHALAGGEQQQRWQAETDAVKAEMAKIKEQLQTAEGPRQRELEEQLREAEARLPAPLPTISTVRNVAAERSAVHLLERGDPGLAGEPLGPRVLGVLLPDDVPELPPDLDQPRRTLAEWIVARDNPLAARVIVNRIWQYHFGVGLVATANDFGVNGAAPTHPQLLDWLACELIDGGWQLKRIHRTILTSATYQQASAVHAPHSASPASNPQSASGAPAKVGHPPSDNRLLWRFNRRRLAANEIRDGMLAASGLLQLRMGGPSVMAEVEQELIDLLYKPTQWQVSAEAAERHRRAVYLIAKRNLRLPFMETFDQPDLQTSCARRESSTHAPQALELLNGQLSNRLAAAFADRLRREAGDDPAQQIERAFTIVAARPPTADELRLSLEFLNTQPLEEFALAMFNVNAFLYVD